MLKRVAIRNFRSIRDAEIEFSPSGLNVIVGANGSGKSNLVKFLEFLSAVARTGLATPLSRRGIEGFVPKALAASEIDSTDFAFSYEIELPRFPGYPEGAPEMRAAHAMHLRYARTGPSLEREELTFFDPLLVQQFFRLSESGSTQVAEPASTFRVFDQQSLITFRRDSSNGVTIEARPRVSAENISAYLRWFNLPILEDAFSGEQARELLPTLSRLERSAAAADLRGADASLPDKPGMVSFLDTDRASALTIAPEFLALRRALSAIRRYDLQLTQLRRDSRKDLRVLTREGSGMPGAIRQLQNADDGGASWQRIVSTMSIIAPHIIGTRVSALSPEEEIIEFIESRAGRAVESWESSDGTLRALATLVALERHTATGTILIEEPEQGLHPWAIAALIEHIREAIRERGIQVILTTHSQQVLESIEPNELLVAERTPERGTRFLTIQDILPAGSQISMGDVGRMWVKGLLRGVPTPEDRDT